MDKKHTHSATCGCGRCGLTLGDLVEWTGGRSALPQSARGARVACVWNDSRKVTRGDVFVAIATENDDGHRYAGAAFKAGAAAVIVNKNAKVDCSENDRKKLIAVADPLKAVERAAARYRKELGLLVVGVTGSSGKTTTRSFIASVLRRAGGAVGETYTNWNNHIGVPLSLLRFDGSEIAGVIEMGANHEHEIGPLSKIAAPDIAVITNIGYAHVGLFGSLAATTRAKFEIADGLNKKDGFLLLNGDDERLVAESRKRGLKTVFFGLSARCAVRPTAVSLDPATGLTFDLDGTTFFVPVPGRHFLYSALPAIFLGRRCGIPEEKIARALGEQRPVALRGTVEKKQGVSFIVDCYNANPSSMKSAVATLVAMAEPRKRVAIVGDMRELGRYSEKLHRELGATLAASRIDRVIAVGEFAGSVASGAIKGGLPKGRITTVKSAEEAVAPAKKLVAKGDVVLIKGSRGVHLETVFENI